MSLRWHALLLGLCVTVACDTASGVDPFNTQSQVPSGPAAPVLSDADNPCRQSPLPAPLPLSAAIERSLCESPKTHSAWASVKAAAAVVGESKSQYLPTLDGTADYSASWEDTSVSDHPELHSHYGQAVNSEGLSLGWLLYDFGAREATVKGSRFLEVAAQANQSLIVQGVFANTAKDYYTAQAAGAAVEAAARIETDAQQTLDAATARYKTGVAPITDQLLANTSFAQSQFQRSRAEGTYRIAVGMLASDMSLAVDASLQLPQLDQSALPDTHFVHAVHDLVDEALQSHPSIAVARAQWQAAQQDVRVAQAQGLPKLSLAGTASHSDQPQSSNLGEPEYPATEHQAAIGLSIQIPLFEGFSRQYKIREAKARAESGAEAVRDAQQQVSVNLWTAFQTLQTATENLHNTAVILQSARDSFDAYRHRYQSGLSSIVDLLSAQTTLAAAELQQIQAQLDWRTARIELAESLGQLGMWAVQ